MYPDFRYLLHALTGLEMPEWVGIFKTFGLLVAIAFLGAAWTLTLELKRKEKEGLLSATYQKDKKTGALILIHPFQRVSEILMLAAIGGFAGAKIFNAFETWDDFIKDPIGNLFSRSGLTFYGGLIVAATVIYFYCRKHKISFIYLCDAVAPGLMLSYGMGRLGCHFAGDGDWGIFNSAYITGADGLLHPATPAQFQQRMQEIPGYFTGQFGTLANVPHLAARAPGWLPQWLYAMNYPSNVNNEGIMMPNCIGDYCRVLPVGVFPTPIYECVVCVILFFVLWAFRKKIKYPLHMFGWYLIFNGLERFLVEKIRVNFKYDLGFIHPTQAEIIATLLVLGGASILLFYKKKPVTAAATTMTDQ